ncbi:uncharacterized protein LOC126750680 [Anthonomus grandis grandis]|uniref:uncharacterized protein LOC126750680 n=1 Tax=Anthonomus grandis grandis TaxID=2921223 RepID=UPI0021651023|nr:uncharacterized protein LOC126750680 [Anthonomus grandis grandis]
MVEEGYEELLIRRQMAKHIRKEIHRQIKLMLEKKIRELFGDMEDEMEGLQDSSEENQQARPDSGVTDIDNFEAPMEETPLFLNSIDTLNEPSQSRASPLINSLEHTADSLIDMRMERMRRAKKMQERRRLLTLPDSSEADDNNNNEVTIGRGDRSRADLYCCYALYLFLVAVVFWFAIFYAWMPLIVNAIEKRKS